MQVQQCIERTVTNRSRALPRERYYPVLSGSTQKGLVVIAGWEHLSPCRTQKLSIPAAKIVGNCENSKLPGEKRRYKAMYLFFLFLYFFYFF